MYAVIEDSGTQFRVAKGDVIAVDRRDLPDAQKTLEFDKVLLIGGGEQPKIGTPYVPKAAVTAEVLAEQRADKITGIKFKRRKNYRRKIGHRQPYLKVRITDIKT